MVGLTEKPSWCSKGVRRKEKKRKRKESRKSVGQKKRNIEADRTKDLKNPKKEC